MLTILLQCDGFWAWPWPLILAFLLGMLLGWLLKSMLSNETENKEEIDYKSKYFATKKELDNCNENVNALQQKTYESLSVTPKKEKKKKVKKSVKTPNVILTGASSKKDDLTKVEGIGPKIKELLYNAGIYTFEQLSKTATDKLKQILDDAGPRYRMHKPLTWAQQAKMAAEGKWDELKKWQDELKGGL
jgi:predicted flap endonuclease-1-like 5' DNA nuclease